jgi:hypothetical protein
MECHINVNSTPPTELPHTFSYIVAIFIHNHFESAIIIHYLKSITSVIEVFTRLSCGLKHTLFFVL